MKYVRRVAREGKRRPPKTSFMAAFFGGRRGGSRIVIPRKIPWEFANFTKMTGR